MGQKNTTATPQESAWPPGVPRPRWVFVANLVLLAALLLGHNASLFTRTIHEEGDYAACSIQIMQAKRLELLVGNYSRIGFHHPGPAILYVEAAAELLFYDRLRLVPTPANAHMLGALALDAVLLALSLAILHAYFRTLLTCVTAPAVFLVYFAVNGQLASHWMPHLYFAPFLLLLVATASVAGGAARHLPWLAVAGGLLVHGHVCFVAFVGVLGCYALFGLLRHYAFSPRQLCRLHPGPCAAFAALVGLFLLPIALHTLLHFPGEFAKYLGYTFRADRATNPLGAVAEYLVQVFTSEAANPWLVALLALAAFALTMPRRTDGPRGAYTWQALATCGLATAVMAVYAFRGVDDLAMTYTGIFFGAVLLFLVTVAALNAVVLFGTTARQRVVLTCVALAAALGAAACGQFHNAYAGSPFLATLADRVEATKEDDRPIVITHPHEQWVNVTGFLVEMERRGRRVFVAEPDLEYLYTPQHVQGWQTLSTARHLHFTTPDDSGARVGRVVYEDDRVSVCEVAAP